MNVKLETIEKNVVQLEIEVDAEKFEAGMQKSFLKNAKKFNISGFRKGKAPRKMVERYYGEQVLYEDAINIVCPEAYDQAVKDNELHPVDRPEIDVKQVGNGSNLVFTAKVTTKPDVVLGEYKNVEVEKQKVVITDEDVEKEIGKAVEKNARLIPIEDRGVQSGDTAIIDFEGSIDGKPFEGGEGKGFKLTIGSGQFIPGFEDQLNGMEAGDERDISVTFPEDYGKKDLAGKQAQFKVKLNEIKIKELPVVDDEFAKDVSEFDTLEAYKEDIKKKLMENAEYKAKHDMENRLIQKIVDNASVEIPQVMIEKRIDANLYDMNLRLQYQGLTLEKYLEIMGVDVKAFRQQLSGKAGNEVKTQLVIEKIGKVENIEVSEEEVNGEIKRLAENYKQSEEEFKKHLKEDDIEYIKNDLAAKKEIDLLVQNADIVLKEHMEEAADRDGADAESLEQELEAD